MFNPQIALDSTYLAFGSAAVVETESDRGVTVMDAAPDEDVSWDGRGVSVPTRRLKIRATELGAIAKGSVLVIGSERLLVQAKPEFKDSRRLEARLDTRPAI